MTSSRPRDVPPDPPPPARQGWAGWVGAQPDPRRWAAYLDSAIHLDLGQHGAFLLTPGHGGHGTHPDVEGDLHIVTAYNPGRMLSDAENRRRDRQLRHELEAAGQTFHDAVGMALDTDHFEPSVVIMGASADTALALARRFGQDAIFTVSGHALVLVPTHGGPPLVRPCRSIATRPGDRVATPDQSPLDLDDPQSLVAFWKRTGAVRLNIDRSVAGHMRDRRDRDNPVVVPGIPPAWHEVEAGLWMGDGRCAPGHQFDRVITLDQAVADHRPPDRTVDLVLAMQEAAPIDEPASGWPSATSSTGFMLAIGCWCAAATAATGRVWSSAKHSWPSGCHATRSSTISVTIEAPTRSPIRGSSSGSPQVPNLEPTVSLTAARSGFTVRGRRRCGPASDG